MSQDPELIGESGSWAPLLVRRSVHVAMSAVTSQACSTFLLLRVVLSPLYLSAWLTGYEHPVIETINQRIEDLTGLEMDTAEELQVDDHPGGFSLPSSPHSRTYHI